jgi:lipopolysaccharide export LptBFGC system permease protein LptF
MEALLTFISSLSAPATIVIMAFVFYLILRAERERDKKVELAKKKYESRDLKFVKEMMNKVVVHTYSNIDKKIANTDKDLMQQKMLYRLMLDKHFNFKVYYIVKQNILENGFHELTETELIKYIEDKAIYIYEDAIISLKTDAGDLIPDILPLIGENFGQENAVKFYDAIIRNCLENKKYLEQEIKELSKGISIKKALKILK